MTPRQEKALIEAVVHLLEDYDDRLDNIASAMTDGGSEDEAMETDEFRQRLEGLRRVLMGKS